ncbi:MAG: hypothetical protein H6702_06495 [Myxococcales bacterium]|nr:hypothetical protein [Myxococcales bacterium]
MTAPTDDPCWRCGAAAQGLALTCGACGAPLPPRPGLNAFERLGLPVAFAQPPGAVRTARRVRLLAVHPDRYVKSEPRARELSLAHAVAINDAARAIELPYERVSYLMSLKAKGAPRRMDPDDWQAVHELKLVLRELDHTDAHVERSRVARQVAEQYERGLNEVGAALDAGEVPAAELMPRVTLLRALRSVIEAVQA